ncbi:ABC transporter permease [Agrococcus sp. HG114]|uniref:ABC transporter permease n=1 Tax=Agrococcus sp. HG114 TaxID=2969757 RepID=UPI00215AA2CE|nr:ABC transporter permease [Agrococcus sp. HG114]MCR8669574.1 ABC transporter permease [Agrococcus sp. HG114]
MLRYILGRLLAMIPTVAVPMVLLFLLLRLTPGDPAVVMLGEDASVEQIEALREEMGLNEPLIVQFVAWLGRMATFDFGSSIFLRTDVSSAVLGAAAVTAQLAIFAMLIAVLVGPLLGAVAATSRSRMLDKAMVVGSTVGIAMPTFWLAIMGILALGVGVRIFPVSGYVPLTHDFWLSWYYLALPAIVLGVLEAATLFRYARNGVLDTKHQPFVRTAQAMGIPSRTITGQYVLRAALVPVVTVIGLSFASMLGGAVVTEKVFSIPGLGALLLTAVERRDYPLIEGCIFFIAVVFVVVNLLVDIVCALLDPRIRFAGKD